MVNQPATLTRVAAVELTLVRCDETSDGDFQCRIAARCRDRNLTSFDGLGTSRESAVAAAVSQLCFRKIEVTRSASVSLADGRYQTVAAVTERGNDSGRAGVGRFIADRADESLVVAMLRAVNHAGLLKSAYRANNQRVFRGWARELMQELGGALALGSLDKYKRLEAEGIVLEHMNRVASAAVVTAANHPRPDSILSLFDTSAWLFDHQGARRDSYTDTDLWLAWYPGVENNDLTVDEVIKSMPAAPETAIPWIVRLFENPSSWIRFRGAVDLEDHDVMHVLLGRGLQDQDEAFVIGFAMGTAKRVSRFQYWVFKIVLARLYPEPYRIPNFLQPAFDLGVQCGQETGSKDLYKLQLKELRHLTLGDARSKAEIDMKIVRKYYELEQQRIPFTISSLRLP